MGETTRTRVQARLWMCIVGGGLHSVVLLRIGRSLLVRILLRSSQAKRSSCNGHVAMFWRGTGGVLTVCRYRSTTAEDGVPRNVLGSDLPQRMLLCVPFFRGAMVVVFCTKQQTKNSKCGI